MWLWGDKAKRNLALKACLVTMVGVGLNQIIALVWYHPRPSMIGLGHTWLPHVADSSFPSDHVTVFSSIGLSLLLGGAVRSGLLTLIAGLVVAWSRVFLGVHFPMDMLGAIGVACLTYMAVVPVWRKLGDVLTQFMEWLYRKTMARPIERGWVRR
jgi:undecaprenyl-diphosphatase